MGSPGRGLRRPVADYMALLLALCTVPAAWVALRLVPFRRLIREDEAEMPRPKKRTLRAFDRRICWAVEAVGHRLFRRRPCLVQALAGKWLLQRRGLSPRLQIGVQRTQASIRAHAWLVFNQEIIVGGEDSARVYQAFTGLDAAVHSDARSRLSLSEGSAATLDEGDKHAAVRRSTGLPGAPTDIPEHR